MAEYKKDITTGSVVAILIISCLSIAVQLVFPPGVSRASFGFAWVVGHPDSADGGNRTTSKVTLLYTHFVFNNGTTIRLPKGDAYSNYEGQIDALDLREIQVSLPSLSMTIESRGYGPDCDIEFVKNTTIRTSLNCDNQRYDLGEYHCWNSTSYESCVGGRGTGYGDRYGVGKATGAWTVDHRSGSWGVPIWKLTTTTLAGMLEASGSATIEFYAILELRIRYNFTSLPNDEMHDETMTWNGTIGEMEITYDQGNLAQIRYGLKSVWLTKCLILK
jgi:hypothetical protein